MSGLCLCPSLWQCCSSALGLSWRRVNQLLTNFTLQICHKSFKRPQDLKKHEKIHTEEHHAKHAYSKAVTVAQTPNSTTQIKAARKQSATPALPTPAVPPSAAMYGNMDPSAASAILAFHQAQQLTLANIVAQQQQMNMAHASQLMGMPAPYSAEAAALANAAHASIMAGQAPQMSFGNMYGGITQSMPNLGSFANSYSQQPLPPSSRPQQDNQPTIQQPKGSSNSTSFQGLYPTLPVSPLLSGQSQQSPVSSASSVQSLHSPNRTSFSSLGDSPHEILGSPPFDGQPDNNNFMFNKKSPSDHHSNRSHSAGLSAPEPSSAGRRKRPLEDEVMEIMGDFKRGRLSDIDDGQSSSI